MYRLSFILENGCILRQLQHNDSRFAYLPGQCQPRNFRIWHPKFLLSCQSQPALNIVLVFVVLGTLFSKESFVLSFLIFFILFLRKRGMLTVSGFVPSVKFPDLGNEIPGQETGWPATTSSLVCPRDLPVCRHRSVLPTWYSHSLTRSTRQYYDATFKVESSAT